MNYRCLPLGICSWEFRILCGNTLVAATRHDWMTEQGAIEIDGRTLAIVKHGVTSGQWSLEEDGETIAEAFKPNPFTRRFEITAFQESFELLATPMSRCFYMNFADKSVATFVPDHPLTRRSRIEADDAVPVEVVTFAFWLAVTCWKRAAKSSGGGG